MNQFPVYLDVAVPTPLRRSFQYLAPDQVSLSKPQPGMRVEVPFGKRRVLGILLGTSTETTIETGKLKQATRIVDDAPAITGALLKLCLWAADYYHHPIGEVLATGLPVLLRQGESLTASVDCLELTGNPVSPGSRSAPRQAALIELLERTGPLTRAQIREAGFGPAVVRGVITRGLAEWRTQTPVTIRPEPGASLQGEPGPALSAEQALAVTEIGARATGTTLLYGITGSGKTEVYLRLLEQVLRQGRQALVLVPEIALTPQTVSRFTARFNTPVVILHSGQTDRERLDGWRMAREGACGIVIGTRSAVFTPLARPGLLIIDEEHDASFKQQEGFRYSARDLAVMRGHLEKIPVVLGSATPSTESWYNARSGKYALATLSTRPAGATLARYQLHDMSHGRIDEGFATELVTEMRQHLERGDQVMIFLNRRGFAPVLYCPGCNWIAGCTRCDARMTLHRQQRTLVCHHCGSQRQVPPTCPDCGTRELTPLGAGTQRLESALNLLLPGYPVIRIDRDSTRPREAMTNFMAQINAGAPMLLVGTQMLAKGHHFPNVTLVVIQDMDSGFFSANYRAEERMGQLVLQVGGRAGRASKPGKVAIQTRMPDQPIFRRLIQDGYAAFADTLLEERQQHGLPPFSFHVLLRAEAGERALPVEFLEELLPIADAHPLMTALGPVAAVMERRAGRYRAQLLLTSKTRKPLHEGTRAIIEAAGKARLARRVRWSVDVDPVDLL
ncbi:MAG: primosomal protein N' [Pseudomonadota bacterium]